MIYAIVDLCGRQIWVELGKFYDVNYLEGNPGDIIHLRRVLFLSSNNIIKLGMPCLHSTIVKVKILKHHMGRKLTIFKIKPKKNIRCKKGHRQKLTRILVEEIK
uniref:Large ribosomal subunit protein bL21c n=1 Tax=Acrosorium ciliolatum TaxID=1550622 RepID=A0A1Z1M1F4_9FLOR|nr:ribosomal protein L21 [Acrosorium ciliolatum]ARW59918.1 ribosomal protein L21 [Acrosorium ciliolatum]